MILALSSMKLWISGRPFVDPGYKIFLTLQPWVSQVLITNLIWASQLTHLTCLCWKTTLNLNLLYIYCPRKREFEPSASLNHYDQLENLDFLGTNRTTDFRCFSVCMSGRGCAWKSYLLSHRIPKKEALSLPILYSLWKYFYFLKHYQTKLSWWDFQQPILANNWCLNIFTKRINSSKIALQDGVGYGVRFLQRR